MIIIYLLLGVVVQTSCPIDPGTNEASNGDFELPDLGGGTTDNIAIPGWIAPFNEIGYGTIYNSRWTTGQVI